jgi:cobyrinic acid a,c-diamide synthase
VRFNGAAVASGQASRHLDSWLMSPDTCRELFAHGAGHCDLAIVDGRFATSQPSDFVGGTLDDLCSSLDLPRVGVLDARLLGDCRLPKRPANVDALLIDGLTTADRLAPIQTSLEALWGIPVLGGLEALPRLRTAVEDLPRGCVLPNDVCQKLAQSLGRTVRTDRLLTLAGRRPLSTIRPFLFPERDTGDEHLDEPTEMTVAVAFDDAFNCYFPDTLDLLELRGANVVDFSPLRDEGLPPDTDLVYLGCGHPERFAGTLADNHCLTMALRDHICSGRRVYAEGGGLAYLCQQIETPEGERVPMVGAFPATAHFSAAPTPPTPVEVTLAKRNWLGRPGTRLRGYRNSNWQLEPSGAFGGELAEAGHALDLVRRKAALGSRLHLNFAAQPEFLHNFVQPLVEC